ncbi:MAG: hypothetical protein IPJ94_11145 [Chloroflexi bacterium]|nr:hypothetical protein [Chloroflexota bacterium]
MQVVAAVMFRDGIRTDEAYRLVAQRAAKACAAIGFGDEEELTPPVVAFAARGSYRRQYPPLDAERVQQQLRLAPTSSDRPQQEITCLAVWNQSGWERYGRRWAELSAAQQAAIRAGVDEIAAKEGWQQEGAGDDGRYVRPLPPDEAGARRRLDDYLRREDGQPVPASGVLYQTLLGAYGRSFYTQELPPALSPLVAAALQTHGYCAAVADGEYPPAPVALRVEAAAEAREKLVALMPVMTEFGPALLWSEVLTAVLGEAQRASEWQAKRLLADGPIHQALRQMGYQTEPTWCQPYHFKPKRGDNRSHQVILRRSGCKTTRAASWRWPGVCRTGPGRGHRRPGRHPGLPGDGGAKEAVKANWAALVGGGKVHWLGRKRVELDGMKAHVKMQTTLPCGWQHTALIHKQASLREMNPERPFYLLDDGTQPIPPLFYAMLNKALALPLLPEWAGYLWANGREGKLISLLDGGEGQGYAAWRVLPSPENWQEIVEGGLQKKALGL